MQSFDLRIGTRSVTLSKSDSFIGIRQTRPNSQDFEKAMAKFGVEVKAQTLGSFRLVSTGLEGGSVESTLEAIRLDANVQTGTHVFHTSDDGIPFVPTGKLYLVFHESTTIERCQSILDDYALEVVDSLAERKLIVCVTPASPNPVKLASRLQQESSVSIAEPDLATPAMLTGFTLPADNLLTRQWHLKNSGLVGGSPLGLKAGADARVVQAWQSIESLGSPSVTIAVIDDGFDLSHPDFSGQGKVVAPWDFTRNSGDPRPEFNSKYPFFDPESQAWKGDWHGTACAGVATGQANGTGIVGAAPDCRLMPVRWGPSLSDDQVVAWFDYVRVMGAAVVSCSWGAAANVFPLSTRIQDAIRDCATKGRGGKGCVICFAAGNENHDIADPTGKFLDGFANHPDVIAVAASTSRDQRSNYSNFGEAISVCAPSSGAGGRGIVTSDVTGTFVRSGLSCDN